MAIARTLLYAAHSTGSYTTLLGSPTFTLDGGETLICAWNGFSLAEEAAPTISGGGTFVKITEGYNNFVDSGKSYGGFFKLENAAAGSRTITPPVVDGGQDGMIVVYKATGVPATMILRAYAKNQQLTGSNTFALTVGGGTPQVGDLAFGFRFHENSAGSTDVITPPSGWTSDFQYLNGSVNLPTDASTLIITSAGSLTATWTDIDPAITDTTGAVIVIGPAATAPTITAQPVQQIIAAGGTATFSVTSPDTTSYQWFRTPIGSGRASIGGATSSSYAGAATALANNGDKFDCELTNAGGTTTSAAVPLFITIQVPIGMFDPLIRAECWFDELMA